jgi:putative glutamine amidotransferase
MKNITIGITDCSKWSNYEKWLASDQVNVIKLSPKENNINDLDKCDGIVLSGGEDVHPKYYGHPEWMERKEELKLDVNEARDEFEMKVIDKAYKKKIPMLGICRGLQIANVYFKGTLIPDLPAPLNPPEGGKLQGVKHSKEKSFDQMHSIQVKANSCLSALLPPSGSRGAVNSAHHQAVDKVGEGLTVCARAEDGTIEALELKDSREHPFLLLVQWHPERVNQQDNPFASRLKERFLEEIRKR